MILIRTRVKVGLSLFLLVWLCGWAVGEIFVIGALATGGTGDPITTGFLIFWLAGWTFGGIVTTQALLWTAFGREVILLSTERLQITRRIPFFARSRNWPLSAITHLRAEPKKGSRLRGGDRDSSPSSFSFKEGQIVFEDGTETFGFGVDLDAEEAQKLHSTIIHVFPELGPT